MRSGSDVHKAAGLFYAGIMMMVRYAYGQACLLDPTEELTSTDPPDSSPMHRCLVTKWPTIRITWEGDSVPSLN
ncbi:unnamed protein product [Protopolystoma xenopodis]|uniref:Uncharacterized protein n=1 Tax=Protopolystoma xenopodis TaxID=117903 RepID=A0A448WZ96_9PLAT|nr:unnamed protein product [Protopolystoma xenopodis]